MAIVNPAAGGGSCGKEAQGALDSLRKGDLDIQVVETHEPGHATRLAREAFADGIRQFIAVGGDGTSCEIVNGFMDPLWIPGNSAPWVSCPSGLETATCATLHNTVQPLH